MRRGAHDPDHNGHGVGAAMEAGIEVLQPFVDHRVVRDRLHEQVILGLAWQVAIPQQVADFEVIALLSELLDRIAPVQERSFFAVDKCNVAPAGCRRHESRVEREQTGLLVQGADIDDGRAMRAALNRQFNALACRVIGQRHGIFRHSSPVADCSSIRGHPGHAVKPHECVV